MMRYILAIITAVSVAGAEYLFIALLDHLTGFYLFDCLSRFAWKESPISTTLKALLLLFALGLLVACVYAVMIGENPFDGYFSSEQWEPVL